MTDLRHDELCSSPSPVSGSVSGLVDTATLTERLRAEARELHHDGEGTFYVSRETLHRRADAYTEAAAALSALDERLGETQADLERAMTAAEQAIEKGNIAATGWSVAKDRAVDAEARLEEAQRHIVALQHGRRMDHHAAITDLQTALGAAPSEYRSFSFILPRITELVAALEEIAPFLPSIDTRAGDPPEAAAYWDAVMRVQALAGVRGQGKEGQEAGEISQ